jgi:putative SOS response-associated peptidase YedK
VVRDRRAAAQNTRPRYNAAPTQSLPVVLRDRESGARRLETLRWGLIPFWAKDAKMVYTTINAKSETVATKAAFREAFESRRCIVPADGVLRMAAARRQDQAALSLRPGRRQPDGLRRPMGAVEGSGQRRDDPELHHHHRRAQSALRAHPRPECR